LTRRPKQRRMQSWGWNSSEYQFRWEKQFWGTKLNSVWSPILCCTIKSPYVKSYPWSPVIRWRERLVSTEYGIKRVTGNEIFSKRNKCDGKLAFPPILVLKWVSSCLFFFSERLRFFWASFFFYSRTLCIKCWV